METTCTHSIHGMLNGSGQEKATKRILIPYFVMFQLLEESEAHTSDETAVNIMVLCAGTTSDSFRWKLHLTSPHLSLENIQELADNICRAEKEKQDMNVLREEHACAIQQQGGPRNPQTKSQMSGRNADRREKCKRCGRGTNLINECFYHSMVMCNKCGKVGHIKPICRSGLPQQSRQQPTGITHK